MGGSMGIAVGAAFLAGVKAAIADKAPYILFTAAGGARMQEGILSLMQMPRTTVALAELQGSRPALYRRPDRPDHRRRHRVLRDARRRPDRRARRADRLRRPAGDRADHPREIARRLPARRISARARDDRHGRPARASCASGWRCWSAISRRRTKGGVTPPSRWRWPRLRRARPHSAASRRSSTACSTHDCRPPATGSGSSGSRALLDRLGRPQDRLAAGVPRRRDQRQGLDLRLPPRRAGGGGLHGPRLHQPAPGPLQRAHPDRRAR